MILDADERTVVPPLQCKLNLSSDLAVLYCVAQQIVDHFAYPVAIAQKRVGRRDEYNYRLLLLSR